MVDEFDQKYEDLFKKSNATINEYLQYVNGNYIETSARHTGLLNMRMIVKAIIFFVAGFAFAVLFAPVSYTHLDVYKRQGHQGEVGRIGSISSRPHNSRQRVGRRPEKGHADRCDSQHLSLIHI